MVSFLPRACSRFGGTGFTGTLPDFVFPDWLPDSGVGFAVADIFIHQTVKAPSKLCMSFLKGSAAVLRASIPK